MLLFLFSLLILTGCQAASSTKWERVKQNIRGEFPSVRQISTDALYKWMNNPGSDTPVLIDRREPEEYAVSHLRGALLAEDEDDALEIIARAGKERPVVVYCSVGYRSSALAEKLREKGYTEVYNLEGSIFAWANEGKEVYRGEERVYAVHPYNSKWKRLLDEKLWFREE